MKRGRYYLGRVLTLGSAEVTDKERFVAAILQAKVAAAGKFNWTITDAKENKGSELWYVFGRMAKFAQDDTGVGGVDTVDHSDGAEVPRVRAWRLGADSGFPRARE